MDRQKLFDLNADQLDSIKPVSDFFNLNGKVAVVIGTVGLAMHVINRLAGSGAKVVCVGRSEDWGKQTVAKMHGKGYEVTYYQADIRKLEDCQAIVDFVEKTYGTVDIAVPVAGKWIPRAFVDVTEEEWDEVQDACLKGPYFFIQAAVRSMIRGGKGGKIVTIASAAWRADDLPKVCMMTAYNAAKAGVIGATRGMARELRQYGISVNCVSPGNMVTPGSTVNYEKAHEIYGPGLEAEIKVSGLTPPVAETPDDVARMILAMCTDLSIYMYGQLVEVDGGSQFTFAESPWSYTMEGGRHAGNDIK